MSTYPFLAIDPGNEKSALVCFDKTGRPTNIGTLPNEEANETLRMTIADRVAIEMIASYGMPVGREVFETCLWIGRFTESCMRAGRKIDLVYRRDVKLYLCGSPRAKDPNVRQALLDRFGPGRELAIGTKKKPGPCYGIKADEWAALAVGVAAFHQQFLQPSKP